MKLQNIFPEFFFRNRMKLVGEIENREMELEDVPQSVARNFLDSDVWKERLRRSLLYPGTQDIDDALPLPISGM